MFVSGQLLKLGWVLAQKVGDRGPILLAYTSKEWLPAQRETLWTKRKPSSQLQALLNECSNKGQSSDLPGGSVVKTLSAQFQGRGGTGYPGQGTEMQHSADKKKKERKSMTGACVRCWTYSEGSFKNYF